MNPIAQKLTEGGIVLEETAFPEIAEMFRIGAGEIERLDLLVQKHSRAQRWQEIDSAPENRIILVWKDGEYGVDAFSWENQAREEYLRTEGNKVIYENVVEKFQAWRNGWGWLKWRELPAGPLAVSQGDADGG